MPTVDDLEAVLAVLPTPPAWLQGEGAERWRQHRRTVNRRHRAWRDARHGWDDLYEDAQQRRRALAGSLARELGEMFEAAAATAPGAQAAKAWMQGAEEAWVAAVRRHAPTEGDAADVDVAAFVVEFLQRERQRAFGRREQAKPAPAGTLRRLLSRLRASLRSALFPGA